MTDEQLKELGEVFYQLRLGVGKHFFDNYIGFDGDTEFFHELLTQYGLTDELREAMEQRVQVDCKIKQ